MGGQIPMVFLSGNEMTELHKAGRIRVLASSGVERSAFLPDVPTFKESGFDIVGNGWWGISRLPERRLQRSRSSVARL